MALNGIPPRQGHQFGPTTCSDSVSIHQGDRITFNICESTFPSLLTGLGRSTSSLLTRTRTCQATTTTTTPTRPNVSLLRGRTRTRSVHADSLLLTAKKLHRGFGRRLSECPARHRHGSEGRPGGSHSYKRREDRGHLRVAPARRRLPFLATRRRAMPLDFRRPWQGQNHAFHLSHRGTRDARSGTRHEPALHVLRLSGQEA